MPFTVSYRGMAVQVDSVEELDQLAQQTESQREREARRMKRAARPPVTRNTLFDTAPEKSIRGLVRELRDNQKLILAALCNSEQSDADLRKLLNFGDNNKALAGALAGVSKAAKRVGIEAPIQKKMSRSGNGAREYIYSLVPSVTEEVHKAMSVNGHA
jgi:hypothetical protein